VAEVIFATSSLDDGDYTTAIAAWRKTKIGRGNELKAKEFGNAVNGATKAMGGHPETISSMMVRARWYVTQGIRPVFARPVGWKYQPEELRVIATARLTAEPLFLAYDATGIDETTGPATKVNPWDEAIQKRERRLAATASTESTPS